MALNETLLLKSRLQAREDYASKKYHAASIVKREPRYWIVDVVSNKRSTRPVRVETFMGFVREKGSDIRDYRLVPAE